MTEYELDKIKKSFVRSNAKCPVEVACLLTVIKYYNGKETDIHTLTEWCKINGKLTLAGMKQGAIYSGMKAEICLQNIHQLTQRKLPIILFTLNVNTQFRAYPFYKASEWMPHKKLLLNSIVF